MGVYNMIKLSTEAMLFLMKSAGEPLTTLSNKNINMLGGGAYGALGQREFSKAFPWIKTPQGANINVPAQNGFSPLTNARLWADGAENGKNAFTALTKAEGEPTWSQPLRTPYTAQPRKVPGLTTDDQTRVNNLRTQRAQNVIKDRVDAFNPSK